MANEKNEKRIDFISFLQFIGVISVIFGHSMNSIPVPSILTDIKAWVYTYHMPLFFFVSAFLFSYKGGFQRGYKIVFQKRFERLIIPYVLWNIAFIGPKALLYSTLPDQIKPPEFSLSYLMEMLLYPRNNILGHTWFLFALFEMYIIAILLDKVKSKKQLWIPTTILLVIGNCFGISNRFLAIEDLMRNCIFFWCGMMLGEFKPEKIAECLKDNWVAGSALFIMISSSLIWLINSEMNINTLALGMAVLFFLMILQVRTGLGGSLVEFVSRNSFPIYIMHWPVIMALRLVFYQKMGLPPFVSMLINLLLGFAIPCGIAYVLRKMKAPWLQKVSTVVFGM